jgi:hypothetical protein
MRWQVDGCRTIVSRGQGEGAYLTALLSVLARASEKQLGTAHCFRCLLIPPVTPLGGRDHMRVQLVSRATSPFSRLWRAFSLRLSISADSALLLLFV